MKMFVFLKLCFLIIASLFLFSGCGKTGGGCDKKDKEKQKDYREQAEIDAKNAKKDQTVLEEMMK